MRMLRIVLFFCFVTCWINLFAQPSFSLSQSTIECGQQTCLQVTAADFDDILSFQYSMNWDAELLGNATVQSFGLSNLSNANFNLGTPGIARVGWDDATLTGISVIASTVLFEICYDEIGGNSATADVQFSGNPISIEVVNNEGQIVTPTFNSGAVIINCEDMGTGDGDTGDGGTGDGNTDSGDGGTGDGNTDTGDGSANSNLAFTTSTATANCGEQICLDITANGFTNISSFQYSLNWDAAILGQATVQSFGLPDMDASQFNASTAGILRVGYDDSSLQGRSLADGATLFQLCFDLNANTSGTSTISFSDNPIVIEVVDIQGTILSPNLTSGTLTVACDNTDMPVDTMTTPVDTTTTPVTPPAATLPLGFSFASDTINCGNELCIAVSVQGMTDVTSFRFNTTWDFRLLGDHNIQQENLDNLRYGFVAPGIFWTEWRSPGNQPVTIPDNQVIYNICFDISDNAEGSTEIEFVDVPIPILVTGTGGNMLGPNLQSGNVLVTCVPEIIDAPDSLAFVMNNIGGNCGEQTCMSVTAQDFNNMLSFQYSINYNEALGAATIQNFGLPGLSAVNFNTATTGTVRAGWDDASLEGISVPDDQVLFDLCFDVPDNTSGGFEVAFGGSPLAIEAVDIDGNILSPSLQDGALTINCDTTTPVDTTTNPVDTTINNSGNLQLAISEGTVSCGEQICLDITSRGFTDILSFQYSINWDAAVLGTATVQQFNLAGLGAGNFNTEVAGVIRTGWTDPNVSGVTMAEDAVLFQICFDAIGNETANSVVQFSSNPLPIEVLDGESNLAVVDLQNGNVSVVCPVVQPPTDTMNTIGDELTFVLSETSGDCADQLCMDVSVNNFTDIISYQYSINWDESLLGQATVQSFNMPDLGTGNFNATTPGVLRVGWDDTSLSGVAVPNNQTIFQVCFDNISAAGENIPVSFSGNPTSIEVIDIQSNIISPAFINGSLTVTCEGSGDNGDGEGDNTNQEDLNFELSTTTIACNTQMCADVRVKGFNDILSFQYSIVWDAATLGAATIQSFGISDMNASNFNATTPGILRVGWDDSSITGITLPDDHLLFQVCFDASNESINNTIISFSETPVPFEVVDKDGQIVTTAFQNGSITVNCETVVAVDNDGDGFTSDVDCDDNNPIIFPGATEFPNNDIDEDCDGVALFIDADNDGFNSSIDCDDNNPSINANATEIPDNGIDEDCDGEDLITIVPTDNDGDGFTSDVDCDDNNPIIYPGATEFPNNNVDEDCDGVALFIDADNDGFNSSIDCDDNNAGINGNATEIPDNGIDEDCDGEDLVTIVPTDNDGDGFTSDVDCDDNNPIIYPGATEFPNNNVDEDCDGVALFIDADNDGFNSSIDCDDNNAGINGNATEIPDNGIDEDCDGEDLVTIVPTDNDGDGFTSDVDCDDNNPIIFPGATEFPNNNIDEDCDGVALFIDADNDGFHSSIDCDDNNASINANATEIPDNGIDEDCDGEDLVTIVLTDNDGDGFMSDVDCDDNNPIIFPGAAEFPNNNVDEDCDGVALFIDADNDGFHSSIDCDDNNAGINANATEIPDNGIDEDCDGSDLVTLTDNDGDGFMSDVDCDDNNPIIYPGAKEYPNNNVDEDCDGIALFIDADNDGFNSAFDCDDNNPNINGGAREIANNGIDEDCDGVDLVTNIAEDNDRDGFTSDVDCDDNNPIIYPGAPEYPNNTVDEDCDGVALFIDADNDGFNSTIDCDDNNPDINGRATEIPDNGIDEDCNGSDLVTIAVVDADNDGFFSDSDCDDNNPGINPGATEIANNGIDEDCNGADLIQNVATDNDNDGFDSDSDCDDNNPNINPGATEIANNGIDEDCNGVDLIQNVATDNDNDGFNSDSDCDDNNPDINPGATEIPNNGIDEDCNGADLIQNVATDNDNDGFNSDSDCDDNNPDINPGATEIPNNGIDEDCNGADLIQNVATDNDNDGFNSDSDCDDNNPDINPGATEIPNNGIDEDCNGADLVQNVATDNDNDGFNSDSDCDDNNPDINPGATEIPNNGIDEDCNGADLIQNVAVDADNDGFFSDSDCDDNNPDINPGATEIPNNGIDEDCNGADLIQNVAVDADNDGFFSDSDCDDNNPDINPGATEIPNNGIDEDCNGADLIQNVATDNDNDGFDSDSDCDDNNPDINPGATEIPNNGIDEDCNGADLIQNVATDNDNDGFDSDSDCDDNNPDINPGATEIPNNGIDEDCNGADLIQNVATDNDNDGFNSESDCDDNNPDINPGATEIPNNGIDEDCNGADLIESNPDAVTFAFTSATTTCGDQVCLDASVRNFQDLISFQYSLNWDTTILGNVVTQNYGLDGLNNSAFFTPQNGVMRVSWFDTQVIGVSAADDDVIFQICFNVIGNTATTTTLELTGSPIAIEVVDVESNEMAVNAVNGEITITNCGNIVSGETTATTMSENPTPNLPQANTFAKVNEHPLQELSIYPNPTTNLLNLKLTQPLQQDGTIRIYNIRGQLLETITLNKEQLELSLRLGQYAKGVYLLEIQDGDNIERRRVIRQ